MIPRARSMPSMRARTSSSWLSWAIRIGRGMAVPLAPVGRPVPFQRSNVAASAARTRLVQPEPLGEDVGHLARGAEVQLRLLAAAGQDRQHRAEPPEPGLDRARPGRPSSGGPRPGSRHRTASAAPRSSISSPNTTAISKAWPVHPRKRSADVHHVCSRSAASRPAAAGELLAEHGGPKLRARRLAEGMVLGDRRAARRSPPG